MSVSQDISVRVLEDGRRAEVHIPAGFDAALLTTSLLSTIAAEAGVQITAEVTRNFDNIINDYKSSPRCLVADCARAVEPIHGTSGTWTWEPRYDPDAKPSLGADDQRTNYYASHIPSVVSGTPVARLTPPTEGTDGRSVTGAVIPARRGNAANYRPGDGLDVRPDGVVVAKVDGVLKINNGLVTVSSVLDIRGFVDFSTGNIDFKGDVQIAEGVRDGFHIHATGNVRIDGPVEGARIVCGGVLTCPRGIASSRRATVEVGGNATVGYLRNVTAVFRGDLACRGEIEHCTTIVGGKCHCENGRLIGGALVLTGVGHIGTIGSPDWVPTILCVGDLPLVVMELKQLDAEAARIQKAIAAKEETVRYIQTYEGGKSAKAKEQLTELHYDISMLRRQAADVDAKRQKLQQLVRQSHSSELHVIRTVYPKVIIQRGDTAYEFEKEIKGPLLFLIEESGMIHVKVSSQAPRPITDFARSIRAVSYWRTDQETVRKCA